MLILDDDANSSRFGEHNHMLIARILFADVDTELLVFAAAISGRQNGACNLLCAMHEKAVENGSCFISTCTVAFLEHRTK